MDGVGSMTGLWAIVSALGRIDADEGTSDSAVAAMDGMDPRRVYGAVLASRVYTLAQHHLQHRAGNATAKEVLVLLEKLAEEEERRRQLSGPHVKEVLEFLGPAGGRVIKGMALREEYADQRLRHEGDLDAQVPDFATGLRVARWLRSHGWQWDTQEFPWLKWTSGHVYGQLSLLYPDTTDPHSRIDLHIGPFSVGYSDLLPLSGWRSASVSGVPATIPDRETSLALIAAHALNDCLLSMKDVNDVYAIVLSGAAIDWATVDELCAHVHARQAMNQLAAQVAACYGKALPAPPETKALLTAEPSRHDRVARAASLAYQDERSRGAGPLTAWAASRQARRYYGADLKPRLSPHPDPGPVATRRNRALCWRLLPEAAWPDAGSHAGSRTGSGAAREERIEDGLVLIHSGDGAVVRLGEEILIPTVWGGVHPESVALARSMAGAR